MIEHYWGIDLGGTKIEAVVIDRSMKPLYRRRVATEASGGYSHILQRIRQLIEMISLESGIMYSGPRFLDRWAKSNTYCLLV